MKKRYRIHFCVGWNAKYKTDRCINVIPLNSDGIEEPYEKGNWRCIIQPSGEIMDDKYIERQDRLAMYRIFKQTL